MDCAKIQELLIGMMDGTLDAETQTLVRDHLDHCQVCRELDAILQKGYELSAEKVPSGLTESILAATSGSTCRTAHTHLVGFAEGSLDEVESQLTEMHIAGCAPCRALYRALVCLERDLPSLAEAQPSPALVPRVLAETSEKRTPDWNFTTIWQRIFSRERFSFELAYVGTLAFVAIFGLGGARAIGAYATQLNRFEHVNALTAPAGLAEGTQDKVQKLEKQVASKTTTILREGIDSGNSFVRQNFVKWESRVEKVSSWLGAHLKGIERELIDDDEREANRSTNQLSTKESKP